MEIEHQNEDNPCISQGMWNALKKSNAQRAAKRKCIIGDAQENAVQRWISQSWVRMCVFSSEEVTSGTYITCSILTYMWLTRVVGFCHLHGILNFKPGVQKLLLLLVRTILVKGHGQWTAFLWVQALCPVNCRELQVWILVSALWLRSCTWHLSAMQGYLTSAVRSSETQQHNWNENTAAKQCAVSQWRENLQQCRGGKEWLVVDICSSSKVATPHAVSSDFHQVSPKGSCNCLSLSSSLKVLSKEALATTNINV